MRATVLLILWFPLTVAAQQLKRIEFFSVNEKVKEKYGSYHFKEKVTEHFEVFNPVAGISEVSNKKRSMRFSLSQNINSDSATLNCFAYDTTINRIKMVLAVDTAERFYGCGAQFSHLLLNGKKIPIITEEQGIGRGDKPVSKFTRLLGVAGNSETSYFPMPYAVSSALYTMALSGTPVLFISSFDFSVKGEVAIIVEQRYISVHIQKHPSFEAIYTARYTGQEKLLVPKPNWTYGTVLGIQGGAVKVERIVEESLKAGNPVTAVWIQDWCGRRKTRLGSQLMWEWKPDTTLYPDFKNWVQKMNDKGVKVLGYINPFLALNTPMFEEAKRNNFLVNNKKGEVHIVKTGGFDAAIVNLLDERAQNWLQQIIETNLIGNGLSGWMADFGEWCPWFVTDTVHNTFKRFGTDNAEPDAITFNAHNAYVVRWAQINNDAIQHSPDKEIMFFMRAGNEYSQQHSTMFWMGDQMVSWGEHDGIKSTVTALNSAAMSGIRNLHSDIGGYTTVKNVFLKVVRDRELFYRWAELNVFQPFYRTHEGLKPDVNHQFYSDSASVAFFARTSKMHYALKDYRKQYEDRHTAIPIIHPLLIDFPQDSVCFDLKYQFMFGNEILVAPVLDKGAEKVKAYLPEGKWIHLFSGKEFLGKQWYDLDAPIGKPAVFVKADVDKRAYFEAIFKEFR